MEKKFKLGVIGAGFMSRAIVEGAISSGFLNCSSILVSDVSATALDYLSKKGVEVTTDNAKIFSEAEFICREASGFRECGKKNFIRL